MVMYIQLAEKKHEPAVSECVGMFREEGLDVN